MTSRIRGTQMRDQHLKAERVTLDIVRPRIKTEGLCLSTDRELSSRGTGGSNEILGREVAVRLANRDLAKKEAEKEKAKARAQARRESTSMNQDTVSDTKPFINVIISYSSRVIKVGIEK